MTLEHAAHTLAFAFGLAIFALGAATAAAAQRPLKQAAGLCAAQIGAGLALAGLARGAAEILALAAITILWAGATLAVSASLAVRLREAYGPLDADAVAAADAAAEAPTQERG